MTRVSLACVRPSPQGGPIGGSPPHAPLEGSFHVWPWGSLDTRPRGLSHATPLGVCCLSVHDPSPAHAGGSCHPCQGVSPTYPPPQGPRLAGPGAVSRHHLPRSGVNPVLWLSDSVPLGARSWAPYGGGPTGSPSRGLSGQSHKAVTASGDWGFDPLGRNSCRHREDDPVGRYRVLPASRVVRGPYPRGGILIFLLPASRGGMASSTAPDASAAMAVDREAEGAGALLGPEEDIDEGVLAGLLSTSWPTPAVVDDQYGRFFWTPLWGSIAEQRCDAIDSRRMTPIWTTIRGMYDTLDAVPEGKVTDFPILRSREDWRVCRVLRHLAVREIPPVVGEKPRFSWDCYPGSPPQLGEMDRGVYVPGALGEWTICASLRVLTLYEQREVRDLPVVRRKALYPTTPASWEHVEVPRDMAARVPQMVALQGSQLTEEPVGGPYQLMLAAFWAVEVADVYLGSIRHHEHLWRLPMAIWSAFADLTPERLCSADPSARPLLEAGLKLLRLIEEQAPANRLSWLGGPRGVFRCAKALDDEGTLVLHEGLGDARLPYGRDIRADTRTRDLDRDLADAASARAGLAVAPEPPSAAAASASAPLALPLSLGGGCHVRPTCRTWPADPRDLVGRTPLGVVMG